MNHQSQTHTVLTQSLIYSSWILNNPRILSHKLFLKFCLKLKTKCFSKFIEFMPSFGLKERLTLNSLWMQDHLMSSLTTKLICKKLFKSTIIHGLLRDSSQQELSLEHQRRLQDLWKEPMNFCHKQRCLNI